MSQNNRSGGEMPKPPVVNPASNEVVEPEVEVQLGAPDPDSVIKVEEKTVPGGIPVVALRKGFYRNLRRKPGDRFMISSESKWGSWMQCEDKNLQKKLVAAYNAKIKKVRQAQNTK